jgi:hypothetical protein
MATLAQLCPELGAIAAKSGAAHYQHRTKRRLSNYALCMRDLERLGTIGLFASCKGVRNPKRAKNNVSKEKAGTCGTMITTRRFDGSRITCVCKAKRI